MSSSGCSPPPRGPTPLAFSLTVKPQSFNRTECVALVVLSLYVNRVLSTKYVLINVFLACKLQTEDV